MPYRRKDKNKIVKGQRQRLARMRAPEAKGEAPDLQIKAQDGAVEIRLYDVIGWPFIEAADVLDALPADAKRITLRINSPGGNVYDGLAIYNALKAHTAQVNVVVDGLAASAASLIAMAGDVIGMAKASFMMIHNPWSIMAGDSRAFAHEAEVLEKHNRTFAEAYARRTGMDAADVQEMMDEETWLTADESAEHGFADEIFNDDGEGAQAALNRFDFSVFENAPQLFEGRWQAAAVAARNDKPSKEEEMNEKLRKLLEKHGLAADATDDQAYELLSELIENDKLEKETKAEAELELAAKKAADDAMAKARKEGERAERKRVAAITEACDKCGLDREFADGLVKEGLDVHAAYGRIIEAQAERNKPVTPGGGIEAGADEGDKFRAAVADAQAMRMGVRLERPAPGHEQFRGLSVLDVARICLQRSGRSDVLNLSKRRIAEEVIKMHRKAMFTSTSDFSNIFLDAAAKRMLQAYNEYPATWRMICAVVPVADLKTVNVINLSNAPGFSEVDENGEYTVGNLSDGKETYTVTKYGKIFWLSLEMIINDDLRAFSRLPVLIGNAARRKESDIVWALVTSNPDMADGTKVFHADHSNLISAAGDKGTVTKDTLSATRTLMRIQTGAQGEPLDLEPAVLAVPVEQETDAEVLLRSTALPDDHKNAATYNPFAGRLSPLAEPRLSSNSTTAWYLFADPNQAPAIEAAYLDGAEQPEIVEHEEFTRDAIGYKGRHFFGAGWVDHRSAAKNPGA